MKPCPHKHVEARIWSRSFRDWTIVNSHYVSHPDALICRDCGEWLGLGESDEGPVAVEVRAAEIASDWRPLLPPMPSPQCPVAARDGDEFVCSTCQVYGLARAIATHSEPQ